MQSYSLKRNKNYFRIILVRYIVYGKHAQHRGSEKPLKKFVVLMYIYIYIYIVFLSISVVVLITTQTGREFTTSTISKPYLILVVDTVAVDSQELKSHI